MNSLRVQRGCTCVALAIMVFVHAAPIAAAAGPDAHWAGRADSFRRAAERHPGWARLHRAWGAALLDAGQPAAAVAPLERACALGGREPANFYFLGKALEANGQPEQALDAYARHAAITAPGRDRAIVQAHARRLFLGSVRRMVRQRLDRGPQPTDTTEALGVAVPIFAAFGDHPRLRPLARGLSAMTMTGLIAEGYRVTEMAMLDTLLAEVRTGALGKWPRGSFRGALERLFAPDQELVELASVLRARTVVQGGVKFMPDQPDELALEGMVVDCITQSEDVVGEPGIRGPSREVPKLERQLRQESVPHIQAPRSALSRLRNNTTHLPRLAALESYGQGLLELDAARRGDASAAEREAHEASAREAFGRAVALDHGFEAARQELAILSVEATDLAEYEALLLAETERPAGIDERLIRSGTLMGIGPAPGTNGASLGDRGGRPRANTGSTITVTIGGTIP